MGLCYVGFVFRQICNLPYSFQFVRHHTADYKSAVKQEGW